MSFDQFSFAWSILLLSNSKCIIRLVSCALHVLIYGLLLLVTNILLYIALVTRVLYIVRVLTTSPPVRFFTSSRFIRFGSLQSDTVTKILSLYDDVEYLSLENFPSKLTDSFLFLLYNELCIVLVTHDLPDLPLPVIHKTCLERLPDT